VTINVRVFNDSSAEGLEQRVNEWLAINPDIELLQVSQSESGKLSEDWAITLTILYRERIGP
jgi:hypothetical protein